MKRILLLLILASPLCAPTFVVNVTQSSYQAEENQDITLEWTFTSRPDRSWTDLFIYCSLLAPVRESVLYQVHEGVEVSESQDQQFAGRVQRDKDVLREGRLRLHVSKLRTEDSGLYQCEVKTDEGADFKTCRLNVSTAADQLQTQRPTWTPEPEKNTLITVCIILAVGFIFIIIIIIIKVKGLISIRRRDNSLQPAQMLNIPEAQPLNNSAV